MYSLNISYKMTPLNSLIYSPMERDLIFPQVPSSGLQREVEGAVKSSHLFFARGRCSDSEFVKESVG